MSDGHAPGWYPDPGGRHEHRWWDGTTWTDQVSTGGAPGLEPLVGAEPARPDRDLLDASALAFDLTPTGLTGEGDWTVWDRATDAVVGSVVVSWGTGFVVRTSYTVRDGAGRDLLTLERAGQIGWLGLRGTDHTDGAAVRTEARGLAFTLHAPQSDAPGAPEVAWASGRASALRWTSQGRALEGQAAADLVGHDGAPVGSIRVTEPPPPHPYRRADGPTWAYLDRPDDLPGRVRTLGVAAVAMLALMVTDIRDGQSRRHRSRT